MQPPATPTAAPTESETQQARSKLQIMRKQLAQRAMQRHSLAIGGRAPARRADEFAPRFDDPSKMVFEAQLVQLVASCLLDPGTVLPLDAEALHKRVCIVLNSSSRG